MRRAQAEARTTQSEGNTSTSTVSEPSSPTQPLAGSAKSVSSSSCVKPQSFSRLGRETQSAQAPLCYLQARRRARGCAPRCYGATRLSNWCCVILTSAGAVRLGTMSAKRANLTQQGDRRDWKSLVTARYSDRNGTVLPRGNSSRRHEKPPALNAAP